jgi:hypothetical protein
MLYIFFQNKFTFYKLHWNLSSDVYSFCKNEGISIKQALLVPEASDLLYLTLSEEALLQFHLFQALILDLDPPMGTDTWTFWKLCDYKGILYL